MIQRTLILLPQVSANETSAMILEWFKARGDRVKAGEAVCAIETTKSVFDVEAESEGILYPLAGGGDTAEVGHPIAVLSSSAEDDPESIRAWVRSMEERKAARAPAGRASTKKAEILAERHGIALERVPSSGGRITEADVRAYLETLAPLPAAAPPETPPAAGRVQRLLILGGGDGAVQVLDAAGKTAGQRGVAIMDDNSALHGRTILGAPVLGPISPARAEELAARGDFDAAIISISTIIPLRRRIFEEFSARKIEFANVIHPTACIGSNVSLGRGNVILAFCHLGACASVGNNNFLSAYVSIEHHGSLGSHCSFGPAVITSSRVEIGDGARFGTGIFIEPKIIIGESSVIGSGSILRGDLPAGSVLKTRLAQVLRRKKTPE